MKPFTKRTFDFPLLLSSLSAATIHLPTLAHALYRPRLDPALREKIMLAVTQVNDCRYCSWVHTGLALEHNVDLENLHLLLDGKADIDPSTREHIAILFSQHFADTVRKPSSAAREELRQHFNQEEQREIMAYIHGIYYANLTGNSVDAVVAKLAGRESNGDFAVQVVAAMIGSPVIGMIWLNSRRKGQPPMAAL